MARNRKSSNLTPPWKPGQSGNPKGRPRSPYALAERIREGMDPEALVALANKVLADESIPAMARMQAVAPVFLMGFAKIPDRHEVLTANVPQIAVQRVLSKLSTDALRELTALSEGVPDEAE